VEAVCPLALASVRELAGAIAETIIEKEEHEFAPNE
jgi:hypothetical protein